MQILKVNESILEERFPHALTSITKSNQQQKWEYKDGKFFKDKALFEPYGLKSQKALINRWCNSLPEFSCEGFVATTGFGLGTHLTTLLETLPQNVSVFTGEEDSTLLKCLFSHLDFSHILSNPRFFIGTGLVSAEMFDPLRESWKKLMKKASAIPFIYTPLQMENEEYYNKFLTHFARSFDYWRIVFQTDTTNSVIVQKNTIDNLASLIQAPDIAKTENAFPELPIILVGAGPSLDEAIPFLRKVQNVSIIVTVNSSYRKLVNNDIHPHCTVSFDPNPTTLRGYQNVSTEKTFLLCNYYVYPEVISKFKSRVFTWNSGNETCNVIRRKLDLKESTYIPELGTVSACIIDIAKLWGSKKICLVGQDMALTLSGQTHTTDSFYEDDKINTADTQGCRWLPGNTIEKVPVDRQLFAYLQAFNQLVSSYPEINFINTARHGSKIDNVPYKNYEEAIAWIGKGSSENVLKTLENLAKEAPTSKSSDSILKETKEFSQRILNLSIEGLLLTELLPSNFEKQNYSRHRSVQRILEFADIINKCIDQDPDNYSILFEGKAKGQLIAYSTIKDEIESQSRHGLAIRQNEEYFWAMAEGAFHLVATLGKYFSKKN